MQRFSAVVGRLVLLLLLGAALVDAGQAPYPARDDVPVGATDRVYLADQVSNRCV